MINEHQLNYVLSNYIKESEVVVEIEKILGKQWNESLEPYRKIEIDGLDEVAGRISV
jgi:hypothetical protein